MPTSVTADTTRHAERARHAGWLAAGFTGLFGLGHFAWAAGLPVLGPGAEAFEQVGSDLSHTVTEAGVGLLAAAGAAVALAMVEPWGRVLPHRLLRAVAWLGAVVATAALGYGILGIVLQVLSAAGRYQFAPLHDQALTPGWWLFWYALFAVIGASFIATVWLSRSPRRTLDG